jgi:hypothetical protein
MHVSRSTTLIHRLVQELQVQVLHIMGHMATVTLPSASSRPRTGAPPGQYYAWDGARCWYEANTPGSKCGCMHNPAHNALADNQRQAAFIFLNFYNEDEEGQKC